MDHGQVQADLRKALADHDETRVADLVDAIVAHLLGSDEPFPSEVAIEILGTLFHKRSFRSVARLGDALLQIGVDDARVRGYYAGALVEEGFLTPAESMAESLKSELVEDPVERAWAQDFLGSVRSRLYVQATGVTGARRERFLSEALAEYWGPYSVEPQDHPSHGIQVVGLLRRAASDGVDPGHYDDPDEIARSVAATVRDSSRSQDLVTAVKAAVTLGDSDAALAAAGKLISNKEAEAYALSSLLWDLTNIWGLDEADESNQELIALIKSGVMQRPDFSRVVLTPNEIRAAVRGLDKVEAKVDNEGLEKIFGKEAMVSRRWILNMVDCGKAVARIESRSEVAEGTGFLVPGGALHPSLDGEMVIVTNNHVIARRPERGQLKEGSAAARFEGVDDDGRPVRVDVGEMIFESPVDRLDASILRLDSVPEGIVPYEVAEDLPEREALDETAKVYVIGHPGGGTQSYTIHDNVLIDYDDQELHYRSPTKEGSSGSPLFDNEWRLIGLHSRGGERVKKLHGPEGRYAANVGFRITAVKAAMADALG